MNSYATTVEPKFEKACRRLIKKFGVDEDYLYKSGTRPRRPSSGFSRFQQNRELGEWAENFLTSEVNAELTPTCYAAVRYGNADPTIVGDPKFDADYEKSLMEKLLIGKRPDILVMRREHIDLRWKGDMRYLPLSKIQQLTLYGTAGLEVRASAWEASNRITGPPLSITVKVEDLRLNWLWIQAFGLPFFYCQVFFDRVYIISFASILNHIIREHKLRVERQHGSQAKPTIYVPVGKATRLGDIYSNCDYTLGLNMRKGSTRLKYLPRTIFMNNGRVGSATVPQNPRLKRTTRRSLADILGLAD